VRDVQYLYATETQADRLAARGQVALERCAPELLEAAAADGEEAEAGREVPDVRERNDGELPAPTQRDAATAESRQAAVAAYLGALEALVGAPPDAVVGVRAARLGQDILEINLLRFDKTTSKLLLSKSGK